VLATLFLIFAGAEVKSREAGLSVPDWPLSYGLWWPPMVGNIFYEHGHRTIAATVGLLTVILAAWTARTESRRWVRVLAWWALAAVCVQGLLGGLTVLLLLPPAVSIGHALLAQTFLCLMAWIACATSREWTAPRAGARPATPAAAAAGKHALAAIGWATGAVYVQLILGALVRHNEAGLAVPFFPVSPTGALVPELVDGRVALHMLHRGFAVVVVAAVLYAGHRVSRAFPHLHRHALALAGLVCVQVLLGATIIWTAQRDPTSLTAWVRMPVPASLHLLLGAILLALAWLLCLRCWRAGRESPA
jgi:cytochrome c oxidase assembly protein subunit 15